MHNLWLCVMLVALVSGLCMADGGFMGLGDRIDGVKGVASSEQKAIIIEAPDNYEILLLQTTYQGPANKFAWVVPVPGLPAKNDVFMAQPEFFTEVFNATFPRSSLKSLTRINLAP